MASIAPAIFCMTACTFLTSLFGSLSLRLCMSDKKGSPIFSGIAALVAATASAGYLCMALGVGVVEVEGRNVYITRYLDWSVTTPLMLLDLALLMDMKFKTIFLLLACDELMVISGLISALNPEGKWIYYTIGMLAFVPVLAKLCLGTKSEEEHVDEARRRKFNFVATRTIEIWCAYPVIFALCECTRSMPEVFEITGYAMLDVMAKCGIPLMVWMCALDVPKQALLPTP